MRLTASIFSSSRMKKKINSEHDSIKNQVPLTLSFTKLSILDFMCDPNTEFRCADKHEAIKEAMLNSKTEPTWSYFGFKAGPETSTLTARYNFILSLNEVELKLLQESNPDLDALDDIQALSLKATTSGIALAFKYWWIYLNPNRTYRGMLASTKPVRRTLDVLWGKIAGSETWSRSEFQHRLAHELDMEPNDLNTALWVIGQEL